jgi:hypothetical protein
MMLKRTVLQDICLEWIKELQIGETFKPSDLCQLLQEKYPQKCIERGESAYEERYRNDARWAVKRALRDKLTSHINRGKYQMVG